MVGPDPPGGEVEPDMKVGLNAEDYERIVCFMGA